MKNNLKIYVKIKKLQWNNKIFREKYYRNKPL